MTTAPNRLPLPGLKPKDLIGIPWRVAFALQAAGARDPGAMQTIDRVRAALLADFASWEEVPSNTRKELEALSAEWAIAHEGGWWLRMDNIWSKPAPMPESVMDRPTKSHEYMFLLTKSESYYYDHVAIREPHTDYRPKKAGASAMRGQALLRPRGASDAPDRYYHPAGRNKRSVWTVATTPFPGAHFAVMPLGLAEPGVLAGTSAYGACASCGAPWERLAVKGAEGRVREDRGGIGEDASRAPHGVPDVKRRPWQEGITYRTTGWEPSCECGVLETVPCTVLDPFCGSGTTGVVALNHGRRFLGVELNPEYAGLARKRITEEAPAATARRLDWFGEARA